ncbi:MAG: TolC family protein [Tannerellaceae bacterium]|jgi:outer membrane protein TolC|nr:TolC family protein [Tannerellaceae bacterium]
MKKLIVFILSGITTLPAFSQEILTLEQCRELALKNNAQAKNAALSVEAAKEQKKEAFTKYFPSVSATGAGFRTHTPMVSMEMALGAMMGQPEMPPTPLSMLEKGMIGAVMATQPVFVGGQIVNGNRLAKIGEEAGYLQQALSDDEVSLTVEQYFLQVLSLQEKMRTIEEAKRLLDNAREDVNSFYEAGLTNRNDLLKIELKQNELASNQLKTANGLKITKMLLAQYIGLPAGTFQPDSLLPADMMSPFDVRKNHATALHDRAEYRLLEKNVEANKIQVRMKIGENLPTVAIGAGYNYFSFDRKKPMAMANDFGMVFATVSIPISAWWGGSHAIRNQKLKVAMAENSKRDAEELLLIEMQQLWNELEEAYLQMHLAEKAIAVATENVRLNSDYHKAGTGTLTDLLDAQSALQQTRDQHTDAVIGYRLKLSKYRQATGE